MKKIIIYSPKSSERLLYILNEIFIRQLKVDFEFIQDSEEFKKSKLPKINYSKDEFENSLQIYPHSLLFEKNIDRVQIESSKWNEIPVLFSNNSEDIPFDIFAASFYLLSRYEEYLPSQKDSYGRYLAKNSILYQSDIIDKPIVNIWLNEFKKILKEKFGLLEFPKSEFSFTPTIDIDNAFAFLHKGFVRNIASGLKKTFKLEFSHLKYQMDVLKGNQPDPYDTYNFMSEIHKRNNLPPIYFFLVGSYNRNDTNISIKNKAFQRLIKEQALNASIALHPSTKAHLNIEKLKKEKLFLENLLDAEITKSRNHFLLLSIPESYENLIDAGIKDDYSMGYSEINGFRAGISTSFKFYNLNKEKEEDLAIHPFAFMDATFQYYLKSNHVDSLKIMKNLIEEVKVVDGNLISLWHNETLSNFRIHEGWKAVYEQMISSTQINKN
jgi:Family of unknown function (DUF7033)